MSSLLNQLPPSWHNLLIPLLPENYDQKITAFVKTTAKQETVYPERKAIFRAFELTPLDEVKIVILGQDPYHNVGQAHGLAFSVQQDVKIPPSLRNIYKELASDIGCETPNHGFLESWAKQGVLLLNTVLTVKAHTAASHQKKGWETLTNAVIQGISNHHKHVVFILWGNAAQKKEGLIDPKHTIIKSVHPSPLSARRGFFGSRPFSSSNAALIKNEQKAIDWCTL